ATARLVSCHARGRSLTLLDLDGPGTEGLIEGCLVVGGDLPLLKVKTDERRGSGVRLVRSTLLGTRGLVELHADGTTRTPVLRWLGWDALVSHYGLSSGGELVRVAEAEADRIIWRAYNCLYAGWAKLLTRADGRFLAGNDEVAWQRTWRIFEGE